MGKYNKLKKKLCPICGEYYFTELSEEEKKRGLLSSDEFCTVCGWRYDEIQLKDQKLVTDINKMSFEEYKKWYDEKRKENPNYNFLESTKSPSKPHKCPICGKYDFKDEISYDICPYCGWEDSGFDEIGHRDEPFNMFGKTFNMFKKEYEELIKKNPNYKWEDTND